ncbi:hypothetical protein FB45DRAFT_255508 [Roridomyces roridus]|uniref:Secreted protein n=1 Tax=Roridomyces roridus TaxID=1738132 RepID=A0AAD7FBX6_9AGAR|nr:hypothetical protein FB45DRAFT_255508 [Roridomyces roridus]
MSKSAHPVTVWLPPTLAAFLIKITLLAGPTISEPGVRLSPLPETPTDKLRRPTLAALHCLRKMLSRSNSQLLLMQR